MISALQAASEARSKKINKIEGLKSLKTPGSVFENLRSICAAGYENLADEDGKFFLKCFGAFDKGEGKFMMRLRVPAGQMSIEQARTIGAIAREYGEDYIDITTRQQIELRYIPFAALPDVFESLDAVGITTYQTGVDNFRNIVTTAFDGLATDGYIHCRPLIEELQSIFLKKEEWVGMLPRKFNTAILGSGTNDCNIFGHDCCFIAAKKGEIHGFNLYLGGRVGMQAEDSGLFILPEQVKPAFEAIINLFKTYGFRDNRNKNRLHFLIEAVGMDAFVAAIIEQSGIAFETAGTLLLGTEHRIGDDGTVALSHDKCAVLFPIPSGIFCGSDLEAAAACAKAVQGELRLSVEQSFYVVCDRERMDEVKATGLYAKYAAYHNPYFVHQIACAGEATCSFGVIPNKPDAIEMAEYLQAEVPLSDAKVRMYWSACPKGCGIHGVADIGFEGCKAKDEAGNTVYGVHILLGGKASNEAKEARVIFKALPLPAAQKMTKKIMMMYRDEREAGESFEAFESRVLCGLDTDTIVDKINAYQSESA